MYIEYIKVENSPTTPSGPRNCNHVFFCPVVQPFICGSTPLMQHFLGINLEAQRGNHP